MTEVDTSIWREQVDDGWLKLIPSVVTCEYSEGEFTPITACVGNPEQDLDDFHAYPRCNIMDAGEEFSHNRNDNRVGNIVEVNGSVATVKSPTQPYYLLYSIEFHAKFKSDIDRITRLWREFTGRAFSVPVLLPDGSTHKCNADLLKMTPFDNLNREVRRYERRYLYRVWVDIGGKSYEHPVATEIQRL